MKKVTLSFNVTPEKIKEVQRAVSKATAVPKPIKRTPLPIFTTEYTNDLVKRALGIRAEILKIEKALTRFELLFDEDLTPEDEKWVDRNYNLLERTIDRCKMTVEDY